MKRIKLILTISILAANASFAQILTKEDSLNAGLVKKDQSTLISGYGEVKVEYDQNYLTGKANLTRNILFVGHKFTDKIYFFSEMELEDAKIGGGANGEFSMEQLFLKFNLSSSVYITAGLFIPRIGIINENHLPTTFYGNDRPFVEQFIIPSTWREIGISLYGISRRISGLNYSIAIVNGLSSAGFTNGSGIRNGRFEGNNATASNIAVTGALLYYVNNFRIQASTYVGGSAGISKHLADSLQLSYGAFGSPVLLNEINIQYQRNGFSFKGLATQVNIPEAAEINRAYANNTAEVMQGAYAEIGYDVLKLLKSATTKNLTAFARYEWMNMNAKLPENGVENPTLEKQFFVAGLVYQPIKNVAIKADYVFRNTGDQNPALLTTPYPTLLPFYTTTNLYNVGISYSF